MPRTRLLETYKHFASEAQRAFTGFEAPLPVGTEFFEDCIVAHPYSSEMVVLRIHDAWARFCRNLILVSAYGNPLTASGIVIQRVRGFNNQSDVLTWLRTDFHRPYQNWEPRWHIAHTSIDAAQRLGVSNFPTISSALATTPSPIEDMRIIRNYFAHKSRRNALDVRQIISRLVIQYQLPTNIGTNAILDSLIGPSTTLLWSWIMQLHRIAYYAIQ